MVDVDCAVGAAPCLTPANALGYEVDEAEVVYWGRCPECLARDRGPEAESETILDPGLEFGSANNNIE